MSWPKRNCTKHWLLQEIYTSTGENIPGRKAGPGARPQGFYLQLSKPSPAGNSDMETSQANWNEGKRKERGERGLKYFASSHKTFSQADPLLVAASAPPHWLGLPWDCHQQGLLAQAPGGCRGHYRASTPGSRAHSEPSAQSHDGIPFRKSSHVTENKPNAARENNQSVGREKLPAG